MSEAHQNLLIMGKSVFDIEYQQSDLASKIVVGLERISQVFKVLLWEHAKSLGLSPTQIQIMVFLANHKPEYCTVSYLAKEFNITKPTVSDAIKVLEKKELIGKDFSSSDNRSYTVFLSDEGKAIVFRTEKFANPIKNQVDKLDAESLNQLYKSISQLIYGLNSSGLLTVQRMCFSCKFHSETEDGHFCNYLNRKLHYSDMRLDCSEFEDLP